MSCIDFGQAKELLGLVFLGLCVLVFLWRA